jgi:hypothetical protein
MLVRKTIKAKIIEVNRSKLDVLGREYTNFQRALRGEDVKLYSATKQQVEKLLRKIKKTEWRKVKTEKVSSYSEK